MQIQRVSPCDLHDASCAWVECPNKNGINDLKKPDLNLRRSMKKSKEN